MASRLTFVTSAALALALAACGGNEANTEGAEDTSAADVAAADAMATATPGATAAAPTAAPEFVAAAASGGMYEIESSKLAQQQSKNVDVKAFADMMIKDHTKASDELKAAAAKVTPAVTVPATMQPKHQSLLDQLRNAGANFDKTYIQQQSQAHDETAGLLNGYTSGGDSQPLKDWASKTLPVVQQHNTKAKELAGKM
jgi:putative membrane protein